MERGSCPTVHDSGGGRFTFWKIFPFYERVQYFTTFQYANFVITDKDKLSPSSFLRTKSVCTKK